MKLLRIVAKESTHFFNWPKSVKKTYPFILLLMFSLAGWKHHLKGQILFIYCCCWLWILAKNPNNNFTTSSKSAQFSSVFCCECCSSSNMTTCDCLRYYSQLPSYCTKHLFVLNHCSGVDLASSLRQSYMKATTAIICRIFLANW